MRKTEIMHRRKGGRAVVRKMGLDYMRRIASKGGKKTAEVRWGFKVNKSVI